MIVEQNELSKSDYERFRRLVYAKSGINLGDEKLHLVRARLGKRVRQGNFKSFRDYYNHVERDPTGKELCHLLDAISTNTTHLFRENQHFQFLKDIIKRWISDQTWREKNSSLRIWSAGCSSGEEPHSIAMVAHNLLERFPGIELKILATDLSSLMLSQASLGQYEPHRVGTVPAEYKNRYLKKVDLEGRTMLQVIPQLRKLIKFARFNLMTPTFPFRLGFHVIFCRNVMIYFDRPTQQSLVNRYTKHLQPNGYLMIGHSESLSGIEHSLSYIEPTIYRKD